MSEDAAPGGDNPLTVADRYQFLSSEFELRTNSVRVRDHVHAQAQQAQQRIAIAHHHVLTAMWAEDEFRIGEEGDAGDFELTAFYAAQNLVNRMYRRALANLPDDIRLRAAIGAFADHTFLLAGPKGTGKTTLALRLMFEGYDMGGDDLALLRDGKAVAFPWKFIVPELSVGLVPQLKVVFGETAFGPKWRFATDPTSFGWPWRIAPAEVSTILFLEPNFGARTEIVRTGKIEMARRLMSVCGPPPSQRADWLGDLSRTVERAETFAIQLGDLNTAALDIDRVLR